MADSLYLQTLDTVRCLMYASYTHILRSECTSKFWQLFVIILKIYYFLYRFNTPRQKENKEFQADFTNPAFPLHRFIE